VLNYLAIVRAWRTKASHKRIVMDDFDDLVSYPGLPQECSNGNSRQEWQRCVLQDFAALDALEASHLATKQNQSSVTLAANQVSAACRQGRVASSLVAAEQPPSHADKPHWETSHAFLSITEAPKQVIPHNGVLPVPPLLQKHHPQHRQTQQMLAQTSMQSYIAAHSARGHLQQPVSTIFGSSASVPHSLHQPQQQAIMATGVLADAEDLCIDLTSQPDGTAAADAHSVGDENAMQLAPLRPAAAIPTPAEAYIRAQGAQAAEKGSSEDVLMECSTNLLNPGIRVHKYSFAFLIPVLAAQFHLCCSVVHAGLDKGVLCAIAALCRQSDVQACRIY